MKCSIVTREYYPPVYVIAKCFDYLRPSILGVTSPAEVEDVEVEQSATESQKSKKMTTSKNKKFFKRLNPFSQASIGDTKGPTKAETPAAGSPKKYSSEEVKGRTNLAKLTTYSARKTSDIKSVR